MAIQVKPTSRYDSKENRFKEDGAQLNDLDKQKLSVAVGDYYLSENGVKTEITGPETLKDAQRLLAGSGTVIYKNSNPDDSLTVYYQSKDGIDILMDGGYHKDGDSGLTQYTDSDKDDPGNIDSSKSARKRFWRDTKEDVSEKQLDGVRLSQQKYDEAYPDAITLREAKITLRKLASAQPDNTLTSDYMVARLGDLDMKYSANKNNANNPPLTADEKKERQALARIIFDLSAWDSVDKNGDTNITLDHGMLI
jgi:hypothetical protein